MILCIDVGNTNMKFGVFEKDELLQSWRMFSNARRTADDLGIQLVQFFKHAGMDRKDVEGIIISSVVPAMNYTLEHMCELYFYDVIPIFVGPGIKTGLNIKYDDPKELGADRIANAISAFHLYGGPLIVIDVGTAMTFNAITKSGQYMGGSILPGLRLALKSLATDTAKLPHVELEKPGKTINTTTKSGIQSGLIYGYAGLIDSMVARYKEEMGDPDIKVIATGGLVNIIADECRENLIINPLLTLNGLKIIYEKNV